MPIHGPTTLDAVHLDSVLEGLPRVAERDRRDTLIELQRFDDSHGSHRLASFIWDRLEGGADGEVVNQLFEATGELGQNVVEHAGSPVGGFVAAQRYKAGAPEERIIVAVGDAGIGIRESLRPRYGDMTDRQAITQAIRWNVSRVLEQGRGQGLPGVVDGVRDSAGSSGSAAARPRGRSREGGRPRSTCPVCKVRLLALGCPAGQAGDPRGGEVQFCRHLSPRSWSPAVTRHASSQRVSGPTCRTPS